MKQSGYRNTKPEKENCSIRKEKRSACSDAECVKMSHKGIEPTPSSFRSKVCTVGGSLSSSRAADDTAGSVIDHPSSATILLDDDPC
jgi:hypothetical protein